MARRIYIKDGGLNTSPTIPPGYTALGTNGGDLKKKVVDTVSNVGSTGSTDAKPTTLIADAEFYTWGTYSIYPNYYWTTFKHEGGTFHLVDMRTVLPVHDFFDNDKQAEYLFGIFKENGSQLEFCDAFDPISLNSPFDYFEGYRKVSDIGLNEGGTSYNTTETNVSTTGGSGTGLTVDIECGNADGIITNIIVNNQGTGYKAGDVVTVTGGDGNATLNINAVCHDDYAVNLINKDFVKTDTGLKMVNLIWDFTPPATNYYTNRYFELDITLNSSGSIIDMTCSNLRNLQSPDSSSLQELNTGWTIEEFNYLDSMCQKSFADIKVWFYTRTNDSTSQIDFCKYDLVTNTIEVILEDLQTWWDINADVPWEIEGSELSIRGGILPHPDKPLLLGNHKSDILSDSYLIGPDTYHRFGDNKTTDYQTRLYTKNKMWIINPLVP